MATPDEKRNQPRDIYPEWTTRPHVKGIPTPTLERREPARLPKQRPPRSWLPVVVASVMVAALAAAFGFFLLEKRIHHPIDEGAGTPSYDTDLQVAASRRIAREKDLQDLTLNLQVRDQVIEVSGRVPDAERREAVLNVLRMTPGCKGVVDHLQVGAPPTVPDRDPAPR